MVRTLSLASLRAVASDYWSGLGNGLWQPGSRSARTMSALIAAVGQRIEVSGGQNI